MKFERYIFIMGGKNFGWYLAELIKNSLVSKSGIYLINSRTDKQRLNEC